jgi:hypothetical protein
MTQTYIVSTTSYGDYGFISSVDGLKGMVEQATSPRGALEKIMTGIRLKYAYDNKVDISRVQVIEQTEIPQQKSQSKLLVKEELVA